jgi:hypothetical protein
MDNFKFTGNALTLLVAAALGYGLLWWAASNGRQEAEETISWSRGVIEMLDDDREFLVFTAPSSYAPGGATRQKIHLTEDTIVERGNVYMENDIITYEGPPSASTVLGISKGDEILISILAHDQRFTALYIRHGTPIPGI